MNFFFPRFQLESSVANISAVKILRRSDKKKDRVEISSEQVLKAAAEAERLTIELRRPMRVLGWYHSHPHITVWPSHVGKNDDSTVLNVSLNREHNFFTCSFMF